MGVVAVLLLILFSVNPAVAESGFAPALEAELALRAQTPLGPALMLHYQRHSFQPLWVEAQRPSARLEGLLTVIDHSDDDGLNPAFYQPERLRALVREGRTVLEMPVAVGRPYRRTPVFSGRMTYLEFNPTWTVPATIWREDMLPKLRKDANALKKLGIRMFDGYSAKAGEIDPASIDWRAVKAGSLPFRLR